MIEITSKNFNEYFFNVRHHNPKLGQVIGRYRAVCLLGDGDEKKFLVKLLQRPDSARSIVNMMIKVFLIRNHMAQ